MTDHPTTDDDRFAGVAADCADRGGVPDAAMTPACPTCNDDPYAEWTDQYMNEYPCPDCGGATDDRDYVDISEFPEPALEDYVPVPPHPTTDRPTTDDPLVEQMARIRELERVARMTPTQRLRSRIRELEAENAKLHRAIAMWKQDEALRDEQDARLTALGNALADAARYTQLDHGDEVSHALDAALDAWENR